MIYSYEDFLEVLEEAAQMNEQAIEALEDLKTYSPWQFEDWSSQAENTYNETPSNDEFAPGSDFHQWTMNNW